MLSCMRSDNGLPTNLTLIHVATVLYHQVSPSPEPTRKTWQVASTCYLTDEPTVWVPNDSQCSSITCNHCWGSRQCSSITDKDDSHDTNKAFEFVNVTTLDSTTFVVHKAQIRTWIAQHKQWISALHRQSKDGALKDNPKTAQAFLLSSIEITKQTNHSSSFSSF